jgi:hypothetical protein
MKCMKLGVTVKRVKDAVVEKFLKSGYKYCSKSEWKNAGKVQEVEIEVEKKVKKVKFNKKRTKVGRNDTVVEKSN